MSLTRLALNDLKEEVEKKTVSHVETHGESKTKYAVNGDTTTGSSGRVPTSLDVLGEKAVDDLSLIHI